MPTLDWIGKDKVINHHNDVPYKVLERKYSYDEDGEHKDDIHSENMIIHGDNLEALKSLLPQYEGKIKCIYIDPPYNTRKSSEKNKAWIYSDSVDDPKIEKWLGVTVGDEGEDLSRHDKWLCMMYPRLVLLNKLLSDSGKLLLIETKGDQLENSESREKAETGAKWAEMAGRMYKYYMVFETKNPGYNGAYSYEEFMRIVKEL